MDRKGGDGNGDAVREIRKSQWDRQRRGSRDLGRDKKWGTVSSRPPKKETQELCSRVFINTYRPIIPGL